MSQKKILGAHVSIAGGFYKAIHRATDLDATCLQLFTKSNRQWSAKEISDNDAQLFITAQNNSNVSTVIAHASYLINIASSNAITFQKSQDALIKELLRCDKLKIPYLVLHPGYHTGQLITTALTQVANSLNYVLSATKHSSTMILLETMASQKSAVGSTFEQLATIIDLIHDKKRIGVCIDTCHLFAAGYDFQTKSNYIKMWENFDSLIGLSKIKAIHLNDSKKNLGSGIDRHEHIGKGAIDLNAFKMIMHDRNFSNVAKIIETPEDDDKADADRKNLDILRTL